MSFSILFAAIVGTDERRNERTYHCGHRWLFHSFIYLNMQFFVVDVFVCLLSYRSYYRILIRYYMLFLLQSACFANLRYEQMNTDDRSLIDIVGGLICLFRVLWSAFQMGGPLANN